MSAQESSQLVLILLFSGLFFGSMVFFSGGELGQMEAAYAGSCPPWAAERGWCIPTCG